MARPAFSSRLRSGFLVLALASSPLAWPQTAAHPLDPVLPYHGAYLEDELAGCVVSNPQTGACTCPLLSVHAILRATALDADGGFRLLRLHACFNSLLADHAAPPPVSTFGGVYKRDDQQGCVVLNPMTLACACPDGFVDQDLRIVSHAQIGAGGLRGADIHVCTGASPAGGLGPSTNFGGAYETDDAAGCVAANPSTNACACPAGSSDQAFRLLSDGGGGALRGVDVHLCYS